MRISLVRLAAPLLMETATLWRKKGSATRAISSPFALPSVGRDLTLASQLPSGSCCSELWRAFGLTLTWMIVAGIALTLRAIAVPAAIPVADKHALRNHAVHALADVDYLRDAAIPHDGGECVGLFAAHRHDALRREPLHGLLDRNLHRLVQVLVVAHEDPVRLGLRPRPLGLQVLAHDGLNLYLP